MPTLEFVNNYVLMFYIKRPLVFFHETPVLELVITCQDLHKISRPEADSWGEHAMSAVRRICRFGTETGDKSAKSARNPRI